MIPKQAEFQIRFIWWALGLAIFAGFAIGAHVVSTISLNFPLGKGFYTFIQIHGHIQLVGWAGLFILGITLHFVPRLTGVAIQKSNRFHQILWPIVTGLLLRFICHSILPYLNESRLFTLVNSLVALSGLLELLGIFLYLSTIIQLFYRMKDSNNPPALQTVKPFFLMMLAGWLVYSCINSMLLLNMMVNKNIVLNQYWSDFAIQIFIGLVLLPVAFAFSVRIFPLFLRLPVIDWPVQKLALAYFVSFSLQILPTLPPITHLDFQIPLYISNFGKMLKGIIILWFILKLDILTRMQAPWTVHRILHPGLERRETRKGLPDYGEFGRFEKLIYAAYIWLVLGVFLEIVIGLSTFTKWTIHISHDAVRHIYLLGFITHLILGVAVRMLPGFMKKKRIFSAKLVNVTFWLATIAAISRIIPLILPDYIFQGNPVMLFIIQYAFALSGAIGMSAVICLAVNLIKTVKKV